MDIRAVFALLIHRGDRTAIDNGANERIIKLLR